MAETSKPTPNTLKRAAELLAAGGLVAMPTETVYGLAGSAFDDVALARIFAVKERPTFDPLIVHIAQTARQTPSFGQLASLGLVDAGKLGQLARSRAEKLMAAFWPGPLTLVLPKNPKMPDLATSGLPTVAVRMPRHPVAQALITAAGQPLAAPSANRFGRISPTRPEHVEAELGDRIALILDGGPCEVGLESTVLTIASDGTLTLLRPGQITAAEIAQTAGLVSSAEIKIAKTRSEAVALPGPGLLESHYAPSKRMLLLPTPLSELTRESLLTALGKTPAPSRAGLLAMQGDSHELARKFAALAGCSEVQVEVLSPSDDLAEAARNLFAAMRALDAGKGEILFAEPCPEKPGLGHAIRDRLQKATARGLAQG